MAYADLYNDAVLYFPLNNSYTYTTTGSLIDSTDTGTPVFDTDCPTGLGSTHSFVLNQYSTLPPYYRFEGFGSGPASANGSKGKTMSFWIKLKTLVTPVNNSTNWGASATVLGLDAGDSSSAYHDTISLGNGTYNQAESPTVALTDRYVQVVTKGVATATQALTSNTSYFGRKLPLDEWIHVAIIWSNHPTDDAYERAFYINGTCVGYAIATTTELYSDNFAPFNTSFNTRFFTTFRPQGISTTMTKLLSHYALFNYAMTKEQVRQLAWYGHSNENYASLVNSKNPVYFSLFDNPDKNTNPTYSGTAAATWGPIPDDNLGTSITVNNDGLPPYKSWLLPTTASSTANFTRLTDTDALTDLGNLYRSGEFSIECWAKIIAKPTVNKNIFTGESLNSLDGSFAIIFSSAGRIQYTGAYKSGTSTGQTGGVGVIYTIPTTGQEDFTAGPVEPINGFADNKWHHIVFTNTLTESLLITGTAGQYIGSLYVDGMKVDSRTWTTTYGWPNGTGIWTGLLVGTTSTAGTSNAYVSSLAFYNRRLTSDEIIKHYIAGADYSVGRVVKYYDGTTWQESSAQKVWNGSAWVDWDPYRWDGSSWIAF
jgi:hypothetical protein